MSFEYYYGVSWKFQIELLSITEMMRGAGTHYPYVTDGKDAEIIKDPSPYEFDEMVERLDKDDSLPQMMDKYSGE